ncbi:4Fe-4S binding protein [Bacteroides sp. 224]|uniref:4Fe-4S binding protein n=1 Tax=Bacteroides sp. 224 TaxID=2302936 RepID=UPI0013D38831|nr:4Fe-4S binding protein [Bacteroides sp. 224]NDV65826.1 4Fe-4S ferredoxin [Bacteroides sp. 224]
MKPSTINLVYFSATYTTKKVVKLIAEQSNSPITEYDITQQSPESNISFNPNDLLIVGMPVYAGRIPVEAAKALQKFKGNHTPAIIVCVYGNRDYDDALLELKDIVTNNGFKTISAGAFIAQHSIFPEVGCNRPDEKDNTFIKHFADQSFELLDSIIDISILSDIKVKGNIPYKQPGSIPLKPKGNSKCNQCGSCVKLCPTQAIPKENPRKTNKDLCISCGRCIVVCPQNARRFGGLLYKVAGKKFVSANSARKEPEVTFSLPPTSINE